MLENLVNEVDERWPGAGSRREGCAGCEARMRASPSVTVIASVILQ